MGRVGQKQPGSNKVCGEKANLREMKETILNPSGCDGREGSTGGNRRADERRSPHQGLSKSRKK